MKLDSIRELKSKLRGRISARITAQRKQASTAVVMALAAPEQPPAGILAMGARRKGDGYELAVRVQRMAPGLQQLLDEIKATAHGEVQVRSIGRVVKQTPWHQNRNRPLRIGGSVGHLDITAGTLGGFVRQRSGNKAEGLLSNNHVLANENNAAKKDPIVQPGPDDGGKKAKDTVALLDKFVRLKKTSANLVDAATALLVDDIEYYYEWLTGSAVRLKGVRKTRLKEDEPVFKIGRTTGLTRGFISAVEIDDLAVDYDMGEIMFDDQIEIVPSGNKPFSLGGDSGSLIIDEDGRAVALLFCGNDVDATYATALPKVLDALDVDLIV